MACLERPALRLDQRLLASGLAALDLVLPPRCMTCDAVVGTHGHFCGSCFGSITYIADPVCTCCGVPFASADQAGTDRLCTACQARPPQFRNARAALRYDNWARRLILPFKHADKQEIALILGPMMRRAGAALLAQADILVPVPLHRRRLAQRRYNQAALLVRAISATSGHPILLDALVRKRPTASLGRKTAEERAFTLADAILVRPSRRVALAGRTVLLVDDVMTSGATANACATALLASGAAAVDVLVAARVPDPRLN